MPLLFEPLVIRGTRIRNRIMASPMCQYSAVDGLPQPWHAVHLGGMARGGVGLVMAEATAVSPEGRISPQDTGIWSDAHTQAWAPIVDFMHSQGAVVGLQLAHAGRKASTYRPWAPQSGSVPEAAGGWPTVGASNTPFDGLVPPRALTAEELPALVAGFAAGARRAVEAGFDTVEIHGAHGYLLHEFLSPLTNDRSDGYGGSLAGRARLLLEVTEAVREVLPEDRALFVRISATDWVEDGHDINSSIELCRWLRDRGVDLVDVSSGGLSPQQRVDLGPNYQVPFARRIKEESQVRTAAVGLIREPKQAEQVLAEGSADMIALARALLRDPQWPLRAAHELGAEVEYWPPQLLRAAHGW